ncbi:MAG: hypothetical protein M1831_000549 [Alyxoria varia]|nr:MAG: hypothetical protein M1831_000549 [Alyxoria varia]
MPKTRKLNKGKGKARAPDRLQLQEEMPPQPPQQHQQEQEDLELLNYMTSVAREENPANPFSPTSPQFRASRNTRSGRPQAADDDYLHGLPIRQWRKTDTIVGVTPSNEAGDANATSSTAHGHQPAGIWPNWGLPKGMHMYTPWCQQLLRAARAGNTVVKGSEQVVPGTDKPVNGEARDGAAGAGENAGAPTTQQNYKPGEGFVARRWVPVPRHLEGPEKEYLAKRRKGLSNTYLVGTEGQVVATAGVGPAAVGVDGAGAAAANGQDEMVKRRPPPPRRKKKGPGRGRKKMTATEGTGVSASADALSTVQQGGQERAGEDAKEEVKDEGGDTRMKEYDEEGEGEGEGEGEREGEGEGDTRMKDDDEEGEGEGEDQNEGEDDDDDDDAEEGELEEGEVEDDDREEGEIAPTPPAHPLPPKPVQNVANLDGTSPNYNVAPATTSVGVDSPAKVAPPAPTTTNAPNAEAKPPSQSQTADNPPPPTLPGLGMAQPLPPKPPPPAPAGDEDEDEEYEPPEIEGSLR